MGLFSHKKLLVDLGTIIPLSRVMIRWCVDEPSVIALDARPDKVLAVGKVAREMYEKTHLNIRTAMTAS